MYMKFGTTILASAALLLSSHASAGDLCTTLGGTIYDDVTLNVPSDYSSISDALACLSDKTIPDGVMVTIQVANGTYSISSTISIEHQNGQNIQIIGNASDPSLVELEFTGGVSGFLVNRGSVIFKIDGFTISGNGSGLGMYVDNNSNATLGPSIVFESFSVGVAAARSSVLNCGGITVQNCSGIGMQAEPLAVLYAPGATSKNNSGPGLLANGNSYILFSNGTATGNGSVGIQSAKLSYVDASGSTLTGNSGGATSTTDGGIVEL